MPKPLVAIICTTYNHKSYIRQCLDGFMMQKTDFAFEVLIHDDASTDGTVDIIREYEKKYPNIIKPIYQKENQYSKGIDVSIYIFPRLNSKYIAWCEGDDFWVDPLKLQKQINIFKKDEKVGFVYTGFKLIDSSGTLLQNTSLVNEQLSRSKTGYLLPSLLRNNFPQTLTVMFKKELMCDLDKYYNYIYDWPLFTHICGKCKAVFINDITGCYRVNPNGIMRAGTLKTVDNGGFKTLSGAFKAYLNGEYKAISVLDKIKVDIYMYYRIAKRDIEDIIRLENSVKSYPIYRAVKIIYTFKKMLNKIQ
ncbi:glycosyltransferase [Bacteroidaceae bacterium HV4-6-C5C]|nr:glycosyltransferase [Bacteroidaceae bacterium HV4-6-C5C]